MSDLIGLAQLKSCDMLKILGCAGALSADQTAALLLELRLISQMCRDQCREVHLQLVADVLNEALCAFTLAVISRFQVCFENEVL